ncbi:FAD-dependent oxidoreductase [Chondrinema litorale]|uniref:FAD-dependent oxidoreductase n=1 Tax=Chondrinema litorale TaxID=2994555 RepID=UPI002543C48E|nr:FAD-dependent oxidoreductase [Chondrinema litorale]UZR98387.1 FAD-dependent oxidoreductase [Chondrinema litorale]
MKRNRIIIIGGLSAGPSAAAKARRTDEHAEIMLFEKTEHISYATCGIPYAMSGKIKSRDKLMVVQPELLKQRFGVDLHLNEPVIDVDPNAQIVYTHKDSYTYDKLVIATGGSAFLPPIENIEQFYNWAFAKTIEDFDKIMKKGVIDNSEHITIVGAGLIGLETAENLIHAGKKVTVVELSKQVLANWDKKFAQMAANELIQNEIDLKLGTSVTGVDPETQEIILSNGERFFSDFMLISISVKPNTEMFVAKGAAHLPNGALIVNERMETSLPNIYAAGDCSSIPNRLTKDSSWFPMGTHSNKAGRVAGANAAGGNETFEGGYGTAIMKLFNFTIARTGLGPKELSRKGISYESSMLVGGTTPGFYPNPKDIFLEIYYEPDSGKLLGAEMIGEFGVDKRVDVLSTAIYANLTIHDLPRLDLAYAPPYSPAKDPVVVIGYVAENALKGKFREVNVTRAEKIIEELEDLTVLDVRNPGEVHNNGLIAGAKNIPLDELRNRLDELDTEKPILVYCAKGLRGYISSMILAQHGFQNIYNLAGGFTAWKNMHLEVEA